MDQLQAMYEEERRQERTDLLEAVRELEEKLARQEGAFRQILEALEGTAPPPCFTPSPELVAIQVKIRMTEAQRRIEALEAERDELEGDLDSAREQVALLEAETETE